MTIGNVDNTMLSPGAPMHEMWIECRIAMGFPARCSPPNTPTSYHPACLRRDLLGF
ncbi:hypothetical protein ACFPVT_00910 [Corynebacterium choanae]|uniref:hypothetical protein n=1 Tax=Corynebacterium choanae TaxID=1862358 RepID=UPI0013DD9933